LQLLQEELGVQGGLEVEEGQVEMLVEEAEEEGEGEEEVQELTK
jgi:hypothetical protein